MIGRRRGCRLSRNEETWSLTRDASYRFGRDLRTATDINPRHAEAFAARGGAWQSIGRLRAIADYYKALALDPQNRNARVNLRRLGMLR